MTALLRSASSALVAALASGQPLWRADLYSFTLADGTTTFNWTNWDVDLTASAVTYASRAPWVSRSTWSVTNTLEVPTLSMKIMALNDGFNGGAQLIEQLHAGLFDGASFLCQRAYMTTLGAVDAIGALPLFGGDVGAIDLYGGVATITAKGGNNRLDQYVPRTIFQSGCNHGFCDTGCTLSRASFTSSFTVGGSPTSTFVPWSSAPSTPALYIGGTLTITSGAGAGQRRAIEAANSLGATVGYPLSTLPAPGDTFTAFQACDKTFNSGSGQSCTDRSNTQHFRGFEFIPPPNSSF